MQHSPQALKPASGVTGWVLNERHRATDHETGGIYNALAMYCGGTKWTLPHGTPPLPFKSSALEFPGTKACILSPWACNNAVPRRVAPSADWKSFHNPSTNEEGCRIGFAKLELQYNAKPEAVKFVWSVSEKAVVEKNFAEMAMAEKQIAESFLDSFFVLIQPSITL